MSDCGYIFRTIILPAVLFLTLCSTALPEITDHHGFPVDTETSVTGCLSCHDGVESTTVAICTKDCSAMTPHPVQKHYPPQGREQTFTPATIVKARGIKLPEEKVVCVSCHDLQNKENKHLVNCGGDLCSTCHAR